MKRPYLILVLILITTNLSFAQFRQGIYNIVEFPEDKALSLDGNWKFYPEKLLNPNEIDGSTSGEPVYINVPGTWNSQGLKGQSFGTYYLKLINLPQGRMIGINMPNVYSSYKLFINDKLVAKNGQVGHDKGSTKPQWKMAVISFYSQQSVAEITLQVSNFHHFRGGIHKNISIGTFDVIQREKENDLLANMLLFAGLVVLGSFFLMMYFIQLDHEKINILFFALLCMAWAVRSFFAHIYLRTVFLPEMDWALSLRIEYVFMYISLIFGNFFIKNSFNLRDSLAFYLIMIVNVLMIGITIMFQPLVFTSLLSVYQGIAIINLIYLSYMVFQAISTSKKEALFSGVSIVLAILIFIAELIAYQFQWQMNTVVLNAAYLLVFMLNALVLAYQATLSDKKLEEMERKQMALFQ